MLNPEYKEKIKIFLSLDKSSYNTIEINFYTTSKDICRNLSNKFVSKKAINVSEDRKFSGENYFLYIIFTDKGCSALTTRRLDSYEFPLRLKMRFSNKNKFSFYFLNMAHESPQQIHSDASSPVPNQLTNNFLKTGKYERAGEIFKKCHDGKYYKRFFVLDNEKIYYFKDKKKPSEINIIPLRNTSVYETKGARKHTFEIKTPFKTYSLSARSQLDMEGWINNIFTEAQNNTENKAISDLEKKILSLEMNIAQHDYALVKSCSSVEGILHHKESRNLLLAYIDDPLISSLVHAISEHRICFKNKDYSGAFTLAKQIITIISQYHNDKKNKVDTKILKKSQEFGRDQLMLALQEEDEGNKKETQDQNPQIEEEKQENYDSQSDDSDIDIFATSYEKLTPYQKICRLCPKMLLDEMKKKFFLVSPHGSINRKNSNQEVERKLDFSQELKESKTISLPKKKRDHLEVKELEDYPERLLDETAGSEGRRKIFMPLYRSIIETITRDYYSKYLENPLNERSILTLPILIHKANIHWEASSLYEMLYNKRLRQSLHSKCQERTKHQTVTYISRVCEDNPSDTSAQDKQKQGIQPNPESESKSKSESESESFGKRGGSCRPFFSARGSWTNTGEGIIFPGFEDRITNSFSGSGVKRRSDTQAHAYPHTRAHAQAHAHTYSVSQHTLSLRRTCPPPQTTSRDLSYKNNHPGMGSSKQNSNPMNIKNTEIGARYMPLIDM